MPYWSNTNLKIKKMFKITIAKIDVYLKQHYNFIFDIYLKHNAKEDLEEGRQTFKQFISLTQTNERIKKGSQLFQLTINTTETAGIFEFDENHLTLLYVNNQMQFSGVGTFCINSIKFLLKNKYDKLTVFATPYSVDFYLKNGFKKISNEVKTIKGMRYYSMELTL